MILTKGQMFRFEEAAKPLMKFLCSLSHPHVTVMVSPTDAELLESSARVICNVQDNEGEETKCHTET